MEAAVDKRKETDGAVDTTVSPPGRSRRKPKPKNYSSDFYTFDNHGKLLPPTAEKVEIFATSTPVKQSGMGRQGRPKKQILLEYVQSDKTDISNISDCAPTEVEQTGTSEIMLDASHSGTRRNTSDMLNAWETKSQDDLAKNGVIVQIYKENGQQSAAEKATNNYSDHVHEHESETQANCELDVLCSTGENTVKRQPTKRTADILCGDSFKENIISKRQRTGSHDVSSENRSMLGTDNACGGSEVDMALKIVAEESEPTENGTGEETHCSLDSSGMSMFQRNQRERSVESNTPFRTEVIIGCSDGTTKTLEPIKRQRGSQRSNVSTGLRTELLMATATSVTQRRKLSSKGKSAITSSSQGGEPAVQSPPDEAASSTFGEIDLERNSINNAHPQLHGETSEQQFDSYASAAPNKRSRGRPRKCISQESTVNKSLAAAENHPTQATSHNTTGVSPQLLEIKVEIQDETDVALVTPKRRGRPPKCVSQSSSTLVDPQSEELKEEMTSENTVAPESVRRRGRPPKQSEQNLAASTHKKRSGRPPLSSVLPKPVAKRQSGNSPHTCHHCGLRVDKSTTMRHHMMTEHSLMWSVKTPEGVDNPTLIIKTLGHVICQMCKKNFRFTQYYRHHQIWCGREEERATCEICNRTFRAMWMQQHMMGHKTQEKRARESEQKRLLQQTKDESEEEEEEAEGESAGKRSRRKAAKNDNEDDDEETPGAEKTKKKPGVKRIEKDSDSACIRMPHAAVKERLQLFKELYDQLPERLFPDLSPKLADWQRLTGSEAQKYLPVLKESLKFAFGSAQNNKVEDGEHTLKFGHTLSHDGSSYCYTGGPIWAVEWCPVPQDSSQSQFLAVCADRFTEEHLDGATLIDGPGLVQIWSTGPLANE
ncbi:unnamed protein product, partial [Candidula unifasciata]